MTDPDGDKANLTFEVWTADAAGKPVTKVKLNDSTYGVIVSPYVASGVRRRLTFRRASWR
ncbi:hypothetical protein GTW41_14375 [Streptomyces sp. SID4941]|nr:hypothetical protein [Streptomyces sp. SID4941]